MQAGVLERMGTEHDAIGIFVWQCALFFAANYLVLLLTDLTCCFAALIRHGHGAHRNKAASKL
jgi:hypothetical protein